GRPDPGRKSYPLLPRQARRASLRVYHNEMRLLPLLFAAASLWAQTAHQQLAREIFKELIEINTTESAGDNTRAAEAMAARFRKAGFPESDVQVLAPAPRKGNVVVRLRGTGTAKPI